MSVRLGEIITVVTSSDLMDQELAVLSCSQCCQLQQWMSLFLISALNCNEFCHSCRKSQQDKC